MLIKNYVWCGRNKNYLGFTLVELLVIVSIIGILASIAFPAFSYFRSRAYDASAIAHIHTIQTFEDVYFADNHDYIALPPVLGKPPVGHPMRGYGAPNNVGFQLGLPRSGTMVFYTGHLHGSRVFGVSRVVDYLTMFRKRGVVDPATAAQNLPVDVLLDITWGTRI